MTISSLVLSGSMAIAAGLVGAFALMRRMTLAGDALSHVALPGIGLAILLGIHPLIGALAALLAGAGLVWSLERRTHLATETIIGVVFSTALAIGVLLTSGEHLIDALFGTTGALANWELVLGLAGAALVVAFIVFARDRLVVMFLSGDLARTAGIDTRRLSLLFLMAFAITVALGLRYLGALLMGSLIIIPAAAARCLAANLGSMLRLSAGFALLSTVVGTVVADRLHRESGPVIVVIAAVCFFIALVAGRPPARSAVSRAISPVG